MTYIHCLGGLALISALPAAALAQSADFTKQSASLVMHQLLPTAQAQQ